MFKPLLSPNDDPLKNPKFFEAMQYPLLASPKLDGIRCLIIGGTAYSRTYKPLPSLQVQEDFTWLEHLDGELIVGNPTDPDVYNRTQSHVMSADKPGDLALYAFDYIHHEWRDRPFIERLAKVEYEVYSRVIPNGVIKHLPHTLVYDLDQLLEFEASCLEEGYEGIMLRNPNARYKNGRATFRENIIYKLKRFSDEEGEIIGFVEQMTNTNDLEEDELGYAKRSTSKEGMAPAGTLGKFLVTSSWGTLDVGCGTFNHSERQYIWDNREKFLGTVLKYRFFNHGIKDKPRFPRAVGFRDRMDM